MGRRFWQMTFEYYPPGYDVEATHKNIIYWGTWMEAARALVLLSVKWGSCYYREQRQLKPFDLPDVSRRKKPFIVFQ